LHQKKIIVHEADSNIRDILKYVLEEAGFNALIISDCDNLVEHIAAFNPQLVMLDYIVSGVSSIRICQQVKLRFPGLPVIALSCNPKIDLLYKKAGFDDYIAKPFDLDHLDSVLNKNIAIYQLDDRAFTLSI
jgi:DNA-binding response OmpR family regulator